VVDGAMMVLAGVLIVGGVTAVLASTIDLCFIQSTPPATEEPKC
jgi:hypothetical protein